MSEERRGGRATGHESWDELAVGWALHALEPADEAEFARHLPDCGRCARTVAETAEVMAVLAADLPPAEPSSSLRVRLRDAVEHTEQVSRRPPAPRLPEGGGPDRDPGPRRPPVRATGFPFYEAEPVVTSVTARPGWRHRWPVALAAAGVAVIAGLGAWNVVLATSEKDARTVAAQEAQVVDGLLRPGRATIAPMLDAKSHAVATVVARANQVQVVTYGLVVNDRGYTTYVLWGMGDGDPRALGTFDVVSPGLDLRTVGSSGVRRDAFADYGISIEPGRHAPVAPTDIVAKGHVGS